MSVAKTYAKALFETTQVQNGHSDKVLSNLSKHLMQFNEILEQNSSLARALSSATTSRKEKYGILEAVSAKAKFDSLVTRFLQILVANHRLQYLGEMLVSLEEIRLKAEGGVLGILESAEQVDDADLKSLERVFGQSLGRKVSFQTTINPKLIAGLKVKVNGVTYDGTLRGQLDRLRSQMLKHAEELA